MTDPDPAWERELLLQLTQYREYSTRGMLDAVPRREPRRYLYDPLSEHLSRIGKSIRPALCIATCQAHGGDPARAVNSASALEMLHNAFLVHDDIEDDSEYRRGLPTMHAQHGIALAVNAGDMMNALSVRMLRQNVPTLGPELSARILEEFDHMLIESLEGQAMELGWIRDNRVDILDDDYLRMALKKTCWYSFIHPCRIGALIAGVAPGNLERFHRFGFYLGLAFQIQDDLLNLSGDRSKYGKEIGGDLLEGKRTLMLIHLLRNLRGGDRQRLMDFLARPRPGREQGEVEWILEMMKALGGLDYGRAASRHFAEAALFEFEQAFAYAGDSEHKTFIHRIIRYMITRDQ
ncbi:MAG: polyprenyl synthetase family protein [Burkholderiales bacterium]|nr:polyprenyl synthetase family protein [Burkholderiales bacterium]